MQEITTTTNYKFTKASNDVLVDIRSELWYNWPINTNILSRHLSNYQWRNKNKLSIWEWHNIVPLVLREALASLIAGNTVTPTFKANYISVGTDSTPAANSDTALWNEVVRNAITNKFSVWNTAYLDVFFATASVNWYTLTECGVFVDGTASLDTWYLLSRIIIDEEMGPNETLTINCSITIA